MLIWIVIQVDKKKKEIGDIEIKQPYTTSRKKQIITWQKKTTKRKGSHK